MGVAEIGKKMKKAGGMEWGFRAMIGYLRERMDSWFMTVGSIDGYYSQGTRSSMQIYYLRHSSH